MTIVLTGGGSGGHITPLLAVAHELKQQEPDIQVVYVGQTGDSFGDVPAADSNIDAMYGVRAGKFRRYHGEGIRQLLDVPTLAKNMRDTVWVLIGLWQSFWLLRRLKPNAIFIKGGFVGVPVGLAAALLRIPYVTHDSDALPGLANRLIAPWARKHAVALPGEVYAYPQSKTVTVGVPLSHYYHRLTEQEVMAARKQVGIKLHSKVLLVTGGGLGARRINGAIADCLPELLKRYSDLVVVHVAGRAHEATVRRRYKADLSAEQIARVIVIGYVTTMHLYSAAADVVVTRAGATSIAEFAALPKACIVVPNPLLTGGHQLKNAKVLQENKAIRVVDEAQLSHDSTVLMSPITDLFDHPEYRNDLAQKLGRYAHYDAAAKLAVLLLEEANRIKTVR